MPAAVSAKLFAKGLLKLNDGTIDWVADITAGNIKVALITSAWTPNQTTDEFYSTIGNEANDSEVTYNAGGKVIANGTITQSGLVITYDADDPATWTGLNTPFQYALIYKVGTPGVSDHAIGYLDWGSQTPSAQDTTISWNASGIFTDTAA